MCLAEDVHAEMSTIDSRIAAVQAVAVHSAEPSSLQQSLSKRDTPRMPSTQAVLHRMQASKDHPGAILRLAGDRCASAQAGSGSDLRCETCLVRQHCWLPAEGFCACSLTFCRPTACM